MVLYAYHYHPSNRDSDSRPIIVRPRRITQPSHPAGNIIVVVGVIIGTMTKREQRVANLHSPIRAGGWLLRSLVACALHVDSIKLRSGKHFYLADVWLAVGAKCLRPLIVLTRLLAGHTGTHTSTHTHSHRCVAKFSLQLCRCDFLLSSAFGMRRGAAKGRLLPTNKEVICRHRMAIKSRRERYSFTGTCMVTDNRPRPPPHTHTQHSLVPARRNDTCG